MPYDKRPVLEFFWDSLELAADKTFSTTIRIKLTGWWEGGMPIQVGVSVYERGQEPPAGDAVRIQKGYGFHPLTGLQPGHHYLVVVYIGDRLPVQKMITVPELPKPKEEKPLRVKDLRVWAPGKDGRYVFSISVVSEDGTPAKGAMVRILDENRNVVAQSPTNEYGTVDPPPSVEFEEPMVEFVVDVVGTELDRRLCLTGPSRFHALPEIPEPTEEDYRLGLWGFIKRAWQKGGELQRGMEVNIEEGAASQEEVLDSEVIDELDIMRREDDNA